MKKEELGENTQLTILMEATNAQTKENLFQNQQPFSNGTTRLFIGAFYKTHDLA